MKMISSALLDARLVLWWFCWVVKPDWTSFLPHHPGPEFLNINKHECLVSSVLLSIVQCPIQLYQVQSSTAEDKETQPSLLSKALSLSWVNFDNNGSTGVLDIVHLAGVSVLRLGGSPWWRRLWETLMIIMMNLIMMMRNLIKIMMDLMMLMMMLMIMK